MNETAKLVQVYKSPRHAEMYLFLDKGSDVGELPEPLLARFGEPQPLMLLRLSAELKLARATAAQVLAAIDEQGFYLQMPPSAEDLRRRDGGA
jgi:uncharacterized protein YcgL (UPF0745 family)